MTADLTLRLSEISSLLAERMPGVLDAAIDVLESFLGSIRPALEPERSERYEIERLIGTGGTAEVFLGMIHGANDFRRPVAIKRVLSDLVSERGFSALLEEEALLTSELFHPNVISVLDLDRDPEGRLHLVMEYVDGLDLSTLIATGPVPDPVAIFIVHELLSALGYIHQARGHGRNRVPGLVHRDVTPRNVLLSWEGAVKLADFGLAQMLDKSSTAPANAREGTPGYMSPEQASRQELDGRSDLYAVGIVLWELLAHHRLGGRSDQGHAVRIVFPDIPRPSQYRSGVPTDLEAVTMRLLAFERKGRYSTAELAAYDLLRCQEAPRDGRGELVRLLDERIPRRPSSRMRPPTTGPQTATDPLIDPAMKRLDEFRAAGSSGIGMPENLLRSAEGCTKRRQP